MKDWTNVQALKESHLQSGALTRTKGYTTAGDGGEATYLIKTAVEFGGTPDGYGDHSLANGNVAVLQVGDLLNIKQFGATGDGVDTAAITSAVAQAKAEGSYLFWEGGDYLTTASIPDFHDVSHIGKGRILRGADIFNIEPADAEKNIIYVSSTGSNVNDGLSASFPIKTLGQIKGVIINTTPNQRGGTWEFKFAAGTYGDSTNFPDLPIFRNLIRFVGTGTSRNPLTVFDGALATYQTAGMYFLSGAKIYLQYLKFINFTSGYGALAEKTCQMEIDDCTADSCNIGFAAGYSSFIRTTRCLAQSCTGSGFRVATGSQASFTPSTGLIVDSNRAYGCSYGFTVTRNSYAHIDFNEIEDSTNAGILIEINSRSAALENNFKRNAIGIRCWTAGYVSLSDTQPNIFNQGTVDANTETFEYRGASGDVSERGQTGTMDTSIRKITTPTTVTGTVTATKVGSTLYTVPAGWMIDSTKRVRVKVMGTTTTPVDGTISMQVKLANTALTIISVPVSVTAQDFIFEMETISTAAAAQKTFCSLLINGEPAIVGLRSTTVAMDAIDLDIELFVDPNGAGGVSASITVESVELSVTG